MAQGPIIALSQSQTSQLLGDLVTVKPSTSRASESNLKESAMWDSHKVATERSKLVRKRKVILGFGLV